MELVVGVAPVQPPQQEGERGFPAEGRGHALVQVEPEPQHESGGTQLIHELE